MSHDELCQRALAWLRGTRKCKPVFAGIASCSEIPDAIGWSSCYQFRGSTVVECKTSRSDFHADKRKRFCWKHLKTGWILPSKSMPQVEALAEGYVMWTLPAMGDFRYYMCEPSVVTPELIVKFAPDHGLLYVKGQRVQIALKAPRRTEINYPAEIRYLRFAIINGKKVYELP